MTAFDLEFIEINGHDYICDCQINSLKQFLSTNKNHALNLKAIICADDENRGKSLESLSIHETVCKSPNFTLGEQSLKILEEEVFDLPPFPLMDIAYFSVEKPEEQVRFPMNPSTREFKFSSLPVGDYSVCLLPTSAEIDQSATSALFVAMVI